MQEERMKTAARDELIGRIREKAKSYVPEWRFDEAYPDIGTALALVYGEMAAGTQSRFGRIFQKNRIAFLNELDARLLPACPAQGCVSFSLVSEEAEGSWLEAGTAVNAQGEDGVLRYCTRDTIYVSPARPAALYFADDEADWISRLPLGEEAALFERSGENLQSHVLYICHEDVFDLPGEGWLRLQFFLRGEVPLPRGVLAALSDPSKARFSYYAGEETGYVDFDEVKTEEGLLLLHKGKEQPPFARGEREGLAGCFIRCQALKQSAFSSFSFSRLLLGGNGEGIAPDNVQAAGVESGQVRYFPFGERLTPFTEVYFGCGAALHKRGAKVTMAFNLDFARIPLDYNVENDPVKWEWVMKRSDFKPDPEFDVTVEEVLWEYYNGTGWARLFSDGRASRLFLPPENGSGGHVRLEFICPQDICPITIGSRESYYIRARVLKVNNLFKMKGAYLSPVMADTVFSYDYKGREVAPKGMTAVNNLEERRMEAPGGETKRPFFSSGSGGGALYLGFNRPLTEGPLGMFFLLRGDHDRRQAGLSWEYAVEGGWHEVNQIDETQNFSRSGIVMMMGSERGRLFRLFGEERYWLRILDVSGSYGAGHTLPLPRLQAIYMNAVHVAASDRSREERFRMELYRENVRFTLLERHIIEAEVYVNEADGLTAGELESLAREGRLHTVCDETGVLQEAWVRWRCCEDFSVSGPGDRDYVLEPNEGVVCFGDGRHGRIPQPARSENIRVLYQSGGGERTNVAAGRVRQLEQDAGFVSGVFNPLPLLGGCDIELLEQALARSCAAIRHQGRAVTARDYEELAMAGSRELERVRCFAGYDREGRRRPGYVTLVALVKGEAASERFAQIRAGVERFLEGRVEDELLRSGRLAVIQPQFVTLSVRAELTAASPGDVLGLKRMAAARLARFLDPLHGGFRGDGWGIGELPGHIQLRNAVAGLPGLVFVRNLYVSAFAEGDGGQQEVDLEQVRRGRYVLPLNGRHEVIVGI